MNAIFESVSSFSIYLLCRKNTTGITNFDDNFSRSAWTFCGLDCQSTRGLWSSVGCVCFVASVAQIVVVALRGSPFIPFLPIAHPKWSNGARQKILQSGRSNSFSSLQLVQFCVACCSSCFIGRNGGWRLTGAGNCEVLATAQVQTKCAERETVLARANCKDNQKRVLREHLKYHCQAKTMSFHNNTLNTKNQLIQYYFTIF